MYQNRCAIMPAYQSIHAEPPVTYGTASQEPLANIFAEAVGLENENIHLGVLNKTNAVAEPPAFVQL